MHARNAALRAQAGPSRPACLESPAMDRAPAPASMPRRRPRPAPFRPALGFALALLAAPLLAARPLPEWRLDPVHSRVLFEVEHAGFSQALATLSAPEGRLRYAPGRWEDAEVDVRLPLSRLDFGDAGWNEAMLGRRWFDAGRHPEIHFRSTRVEPIDAEHARVHGELSVRGRTAPVVLEVRQNAVKRNPLTLRRTAGFSATAELDRRAFGLDAAPGLVGHAVRVRIEVEALRTRGSASPGEADAPSETEAPATEPDDADPQFP